MKKLAVVIAVLCSSLVFSQTDSTATSDEFALNYFYGSIIEHNYEIGHLITGRPQGVVLSYNRKTNGQEAWSRRFNYPDRGLTLIYQDMANPHLGDMIGLYGHFNFYLLHRHLMLKVAEGLVYNTHPYDRAHNYRNNAYGTHFMFSTAVMANFVEKNILNGLGVQAGILLVHYSNGNLKAPNASTNSFLLNMGVSYLIDHKKQPDYIPYQKEPYTEPLHYNFALRGGVNSSSVIGLGEFPFLTIAAFADKRLTHASTVEAGTEVFFSGMLHELIKYRSIAFPEYNLTGKESSTRVGLFAGYQLNINKFSVFADLGYYIYYPFDFRGRMYSRLGLRRELPGNFFVSVSVHSHAANAENAALTIGYRL